MKKCNATNEQIEKISDLRLKIKHFMYFDGNYKKRFFIIHNYNSDDYIELKKLYLEEKASIEFDLLDYCIPFSIYISMKEAFRIIQMFTIAGYGLIISPIAIQTESSNKNFNERQNLYRRNQFFLMLKNSTLDNTFIQEYIFKEDSRLSKFRRFSSLSLRYGLYIYDLFSDINFIYSSDLSEWINDEDIPDSDIYYPIPDIRWLSDFIDINNLINHNTSRTRFLNTLSRIINKQKINKAQYSTFIKIFTKSNLLTQLHSSFATRRIGLYLWDLCRNPSNINLCDPNELIEEMYINKVRYSTSKDDFKRLMRRLLMFTDRCIQNGKFLPYQN